MTNPDTPDERAPSPSSTYPKPYAGDWTVFNGAGASIVEGVSFDIAADYMTADRFSRGWTMVQTRVIDSLAALAAIPQAATGAVRTQWKATLSSVSNYPFLENDRGEAYQLVGASSARASQIADMLSRRATPAAATGADAWETMPLLVIGEHAKSPEHEALKIVARSQAQDGRLTLYVALPEAKNAMSFVEGALTDERIDQIAELTVKGMPDGIRGFLRVWGWQQFARGLAEILAVPATASARAEALEQAARKLIQARADFGWSTETDDAIRELERALAATKGEQSHG